MSQKGIHQLYAEDADAADRTLFGRIADPITRRGFLNGAGLAAMSAVLGARPVHAQNYPAGLIPAALAYQDNAFKIPGKDPGLIVLNDRPVNAETPPHLLNDQITPADKLFVRNNGHPPAEIDPAAWKVTFKGESAASEKTYSIADLKAKFETVSLQLTLECGGNGRAEFSPPARGNQWGLGAVGCPKWTGVRLRDVLQDVGVKPDAVYVAFNGADTHLSGKADKRPISRGVPVAKAMEAESLIAWAMNDADMPVMNGHPLRLVIGGWPGSCSGKWLTEILIRDRIHDGAKMTGASYRVPCDPVAPGQKVPDEDMCIIHSMPVKSLITSIPNATKHAAGKPIHIGGFAWAGDLHVDAVHLSTDFGQTWTPATLQKPVNRLAWQRFDADIALNKKGYYEIWARATDSEGRMQPMVLPGWNPKGYLNNACHRVGVRIV